MNSNDFTTSNHIVASVVTTVNDRRFRKGFSRGWYASQVQDALQELAFDTFFEEITFDLDVPDNLRLEIPKNVFNIKEVYVWDGACCSPANSQIVHWKRTFNNKGDGDGYTARVKDTSQHNSSPFVADHFEWENSNNSFSRAKYYGNIQNGTLMLSSNCRSFAKVRVVANGMGGAIGDVPIIPRFFEQAIKDWIKERFYESMMGIDPRLYTNLYKIARDNRVNNINGSWKTARIRVSGMDSWEKEDMNEYISSIYHK